MNIGFAGSDGRTVLSAYTVSTTSRGKHNGIVIRGTTGMRQALYWMDWPVMCVETPGNDVAAYSDVIIEALRSRALHVVIPMPEQLQIGGIVDRMAEAGFEDRIIGLRKDGAWLESDKIRAKKFCERYDIPVAPLWEAVPDIRDWPKVREVCLRYIRQRGGAVAKYPFSAEGKGARIIKSPYDIRPAYDDLLEKYSKADYYPNVCGSNGPWSLLIEQWLNGIELTVTVLIDGNGNFQLLPFSLDAPERFSRPPGLDNPITGGMWSVSPHPVESPALTEMVTAIVRRYVHGLRSEGLLRPCMVYFGCMIRLAQNGAPYEVLVLEINIRPGEPELQAVVRRVKNFGDLIVATVVGDLGRVAPEVRDDQLSCTVAFVAGSGGPHGEGEYRGYPWRYRNGEVLHINFAELRRRNIMFVPSAIGYSEECGFYSDGSRICYLSVNTGIGFGQSWSRAAARAREKIFYAWKDDLIRVVPGEDTGGNRLDFRPDFGIQYAQYEGLTASP